MDAQTVMSFIQLMNENPELKKNKKTFKKYVDKTGFEYFKIRKGQIYKMIIEQKKKFLECYDIYEKFMQEHGFDLFDPNIDTDDIVNKMVEAFDIELKDAEEAYDIQEENNVQEN